MQEAVMYPAEDVCRGSFIQTSGTKVKVGIGIALLAGRHIVDPCGV